MTNYQLTNQIKENKEWRRSFNQLARETFDIQFEEWYQNGYWGESYIPYAFIKENEVIANASITKSEMIINNKSYQTIQIGTVMTAKDYQNQGLSRKLIEKIIVDYEEQVDFIYLFANETVLDFYPKFGFKRVNERTNFIDISAQMKQSTILKPIDWEKNRKKIEKMARQITRSHTKSYLVEDCYLRLFYYGSVFSEAIFYIEELDCYLSFEIEGSELHLFDILSNQEISLNAMIQYLPLDNIEKVYCHFDVTGQEGNVVKEIQISDDDVLFVRGTESSQLEGIKLPLFNHA